MIEVTDVYRFDINKRKWVEKHDYEVKQCFKFSGSEFCLTFKKGFYFMCFQDKKGNLYSLIYKKQIDGGYKLTPGEIVSEFRKQYLKHGITQEKIEEFLMDPVKFGKGS